MARRIALAVAIAAAALLALTHGADIAALLATARGGSATWLGLAVLLQAGYYLGYVLTYRQAFASVGIRRPLLDITPVVFASVFINTVTPSAGTAGPALLVDDATRGGHPAGTAAAAVLLGQFADFAGFAVVMAGGFTYLAAIGRLTVIETLAAAVFVALVAAMGAGLVLALRRPATFARWLAVAERGVAKVVRLVRMKPPAPWAERVAAEFSESVSSVGAHPERIAGVWAIAVVGHVFDLACFIAIGRAFGWHQVGPLVAGYAVGVVVWLTSIVPQGVGVVEGSVTLLLASLGMPTATAAAVSLTFRGLTFWLPFLIGFALLPRVRSFATDAQHVRSRLPARMAAVLVFGVAVVNLLSAATPSLADRLALLERFLPFSVTVGNLAAVLAGVALLLVSRGLWHHKRSAYLLTIVLLGASALSHVVKGLDYEEAIVALAVMFWLLTERASFYARADAPSIRQGLRVLAGAFAITLAYGTAGFWLLDRHFSVNFALLPAIRQTIAMFTQFYDPGLQPVTGFGRYFAGSIYVVGAATFGFAILMLLRPAVVRQPATAAERERAARIVRRYGRSSIAAMALLPDKHYWFSAGGSVVSYTVSGGMAVALGDPIGPAPDLRDATMGFAHFADGMGWRAVFYETDSPDEPGYAALGYQAVSIGNEAIVRLSEFTIEGKSRKSMRNRVNRLAADGFVAEVLPAPQSARTLAELREVSDAWLAMQKGSEKRFSMGWFDDAYLRDCDVMVVRSSHGAILAFANLVSEFQANEATIDLMRHWPGAPSGLMDFLFVRLFEWARSQGFETFNLGLSPLSGLDDDSARLPEKALNLVYEHGNAFYGFRGLHEYKDKFSPMWEPRYLVYPDAGALPAALTAATRANSGDLQLPGALATLLTRLRPHSGDAARG